jgi:class 3 adenylate cyclase
LVKTHNTALLDKLTCKKESVLATDVTTLLGIVAGCAVFILIFAYACDQYLKYAEVEEQRRLQAELKAKRKAAMGAAGEAEDCDVPSGMTCIVDTDVESSTALWDWNGPEMAKALLAHDQVMRAAIQANNGLELLTEGDAFTVSFSTCKDAVGFCLQVQSGLMQVPWSDALLNSGNESSARVMSDGAPIFAGLRVRMGAIYGDMPTGVKVSQLASQVLFQNCRDIGDFAHGGQILVSNQLWAEIKEADFPGIDVAALGSISKADSSESSESQLSCVQVLPRELANRVPEFIGMYQGNMDQIRPPCGKITIVFTSCADYKKIAEIDKSGAEQDIESIIELVQGITEKYRGYECKGSAGKFMLVFNTADDAVKCCGDINTSLLTQTWKADTTSLSSDPDFKGYTMAMGVATGIPTMFDFNKSSNTMDYFGPVVNLSARICGQACPGEITLGVTTNEELSPEVKGNFVIQSRGKVSLKGIKDEIEILSTMPSSLSSRMDKYEERRAIYSSGSAPMSPGSAVSPSD